MKKTKMVCYTLGDFRKLTAKLPDDAPMLDKWWMENALVEYNSELSSPAFSVEAAHLVLYNNDNNPEQPCDHLALCKTPGKTDMVLGEILVVLTGKAATG